MYRRTKDVFVFLISLTALTGSLQAVDWSGGSYRVTDEPEPAKMAPAVTCEHCQGRHAVDPHRRAGCPQRVAWYARCSMTPKYVGDYVGGDVAWFGCGRGTEDGTWGVDYVGGLFQRLVWLNWSHGNRHQGGVGAYKTDGPHVLKSIREKKAESHE